jgi:hypothetical protein
MKCCEYGLELNETALWVGSLPYLQLLYKTENICQAQTLQLILPNIQWHRKKSSITFTKGPHFIKLYFLLFLLLNNKLVCLSK